MGATTWGGYPFMVLVALQVGIQPQVTRACVGTAVSSQSLVLAEMFVSIALAIMIVPTDSFAAWSPGESIVLVGPPAAAYALRSLVKQAAYRRCDGVTFNVMNQTKVVFCAVAAWVLMGEAQSFQQCVALLCAVGAGALLVMPGRSAHAATNGAASPGGEPVTNGFSVAAEAGNFDGSSVVKENTSSTPNHRSCAPPGSPAPFVAGWRWEPGAGLMPKASGALLALATAGCSGIAAALSQAAMRRASRPSAMFNLELGLWGLPLVFLSGADAVHPSRALRGWRARTVAPVALQAVGGLLVSAVVKQQGGVAMGLCTVAGIAVSAMVDVARTRRPPSVRQVAAAALCGLSVAVHQLGALPLPTVDSVLAAHAEAAAALQDGLVPTELPLQAPQAPPTTVT